MTVAQIRKMGPALKALQTEAEGHAAASGETHHPQNNSYERGKVPIWGNHRFTTGSSWPVPLGEAPAVRRSARESKSAPQRSGPGDMLHRHQADAPCSRPPW